MLLKVCKRCGAMIQYPRSYCYVCQPIIDKQREEYRERSKREADRAYNKRRDTKYLRFYRSTHWKILSAKYQQDKAYKCERCGGWLLRYTIRSRYRPRTVGNDGLTMTTLRRCALTVITTGTNDSRKDEELPTQCK